MMNDCVEELSTVISRRAATRLVCVSRASNARQRHHGPKRPRRSGVAPSNRLSDAQREEVLGVLNSSQYCELAVPQVWAHLLDNGVFLCSIATMYRLLAEKGMTRERRRQRTHPAKKKPELIATRPLQVWSWDITKLRGPTRGSYFNLYVCIDIFSRYVVSTMVSERETGPLAKRFLQRCTRSQHVQPDTLVIHADRGSPMTSKSVTELLDYLRIERSHSRPHVSNDNPFSEANFKTLKYCPSFPDRFGSIQHARTFCNEFFNYYNNDHYHSGIGLLTPATIHHDQTLRVLTNRDIILAAAYQQHPERFKRPPKAQRPPTTVWINPPHEQAA
jgi:putative transposase